jgi:hypothetical protein
LTHFELFDYVLWAAGFLAEVAVLTAWVRGVIWRPLVMLGVFAGFRAAAEVVMLMVHLRWPGHYETTAWMVFGAGYILMAMLAVQLSELNRMNRRNLFFTFYCVTTITAILIGVAGVIYPLSPTPMLLRLARFADGVCFLNLLPALRKTMPRHYAHLALVFMALLAADFLCSQWQAWDGWKHWTLISRVYVLGQLTGWTALYEVLSAGRSHPYFRRANSAGQV